jgi:hypothetical protein
LSLTFAFTAKNTDAQARALTKEEQEKITLKDEKKTLEDALKTPKYTIQPNDPAFEQKEKKALKAHAEAELTRINVRLLQLERADHRLTEKNLKNLSSDVAQLSLNPPAAEQKSKKPPPKPKPGKKTNVLNLRADEFWTELDVPYQRQRIDRSQPLAVQYDALLEALEAGFDTESFVKRLNSYLGYHRGNFDRICAEIEEALGVTADYGASIRMLLEYMIAKQGFSIMHRTRGPVREEIEKVYRMYWIGAGTPPVDR